MDEKIEAISTRN